MVAIKHQNSLFVPLLQILYQPADKGVCLVELVDVVFGSQ